MKITAAVHDNGRIELTARVKVNIYVGIYLKRDGLTGSTQYAEDFLSKSDLYDLFLTDCKGNDVKPVKFMKLRTEKRAYTKWLTDSDFLLSGDYTVED